MFLKVILHGRIVVWGDFTGGTVVRTLGFHCRGPGFYPWSGKLRSHKPSSQKKKKKERRKERKKKVVTFSMIAGKSCIFMHVQYLHIFKRKVSILVVSY